MGEKSKSTLGHGGKIKVQISKFLAPPAELYLPADARGKNDFAYYGYTSYRNYIQDRQLNFAIKNSDRTQHSYIIGKSGVGKSKFMESIIRQDIENGKAVIVIDPHGDLVDNILHFMPEERLDDVCIIDPSDTERPVAFNPLTSVEDSLKPRVTQDFTEVLKKQFKDTWTPKIEHLFRFAFLALLDYPGANFSDLQKVLTDKNFRQKLSKHIKNDFVKRFWAVEFSAWSQKFESEAITPLVNKLGAFLSDPLMSKIFTQSENKIELAELMNQNKIILINLSKGKLGEDNSAFFGSIFLTKIKQAGMERAFIPESERKQVFLYIDEFQNVLTDTFESLLSESRKYGFAIHLAHQYLSQIPKNILNAIFGNVSTIISFRISGTDAQELMKEFAPLLEAKDIMNLPKREFYIKTIIDGEAYHPFSARTFFLESFFDEEKVEQIREKSRQKYASSQNQSVEPEDDFEQDSQDELPEPII